MTHNMTGTMCSLLGFPPDNEEQQIAHPILHCDRDDTHCLVV